MRGDACVAGDARLDRSRLADAEHARATVCARHRVYIPTSVTRPNPEQRRHNRASSEATFGTYPAQARQGMTRTPDTSTLSRRVPLIVAGVGPRFRTG
jgi:hypothetical protein